MAKKRDAEYIEELESALMDVLDGCAKWWEIQEDTGLSTERSQEIADLYFVILENYYNKHGLGGIKI